jgi:D-methionine transport system substrate-binding protein
MMKKYLFVLAGLLFSASVLFFASLLFSPLPVEQALIVGVTAGPHADIVYKISELAKETGLVIKVVEFNDFILPNEALNAKNIDINSYQHEAFLQSQIASRGYKLKSIGKTIIMPLGLYANKIKLLENLPENGKVAIPNDPTNGGRALKLLAKSGIIGVKDLENPNILDIISNPKQLSFIEIEAPLVIQALKDVDAGITNTDWVLLAGIDPKSALIEEDKTSPYANVIVVRVGDENNTKVQQFLNLYHSDKIRNFIETTYKGAVIPAW